MSISELTVSDSAPRHTGSLSDAINRDLIAGIAAWPLWTMLAWNDIRERYRRSVLGPFWITISMGMFITLLGVIYSKLFHIHISHLSAVSYCRLHRLGLHLLDDDGKLRHRSSKANALFVNFGSPIRSTCFVSYGEISSSSCIRSSSIFLSRCISESIQDQLPCWRFPACCSRGSTNVGSHWQLALVSTRYRDVVQMITTIVQITMFATPIMYPISSLGNAAIIAYVNPLYHVIDVARAPMLGTTPSLISWIVSITLAVVGWSITVLLLRRATKRLVFWL